jgi:hypothetical protein
MKKRLMKVNVKDLEKIISTCFKEIFSRPRGVTKNTCI